MKIYHELPNQRDWAVEMELDPTLCKIVLQKQKLNKTELIELSGQLFSRRLSFDTIDKVLKSEPCSKTSRERFGQIFAHLGFGLHYDPETGKQIPVIPRHMQRPENVRPMQKKKSVFSPLEDTDDVHFTRIRLKVDDVEAITEYCIRNNIKNRYLLLEQILQAGFKKVTGERLPSELQAIVPDMKPSTAIGRRRRSGEEVAAGLVLDDSPAAPEARTGLVLQQPAGNQNTTTGLVLE